ncbi:MAG: hypothetical protein ABMA00_10320 [Gemmatimonas sp.]
MRALQQTVTLCSTMRSVDKGCPMLKIRVRAASIFALIFLATAPVARAQPAFGTSMEAFGGALAGNWVGEGSFVEDVQGIGKKGEKFASTLTCVWAAGRAALRCDGKEPQSTWVILYFWDAGTRQIRYVGVNSGGGSSLGTVAGRGPKFVATETGASADGGKLDATYEIAFEEGGNTRIDTGSTTVNRAKTPWRDVYRKRPR